jgi:tetrahydromethanopterin S-methyltransferase subunit G
MIDDEKLYKSIENINNHFTAIETRLTKIETQLHFYAYMLPSLTLLMGSIVGILIGKIIF